MTVRLRGHHLLCMLTYVGEGYSPAFVTNYDAVIARLGEGEDIRLVSGPDDVCTPLLGTPGCHCHNESAAARDGEATRAVGMLLATDLAEGAGLTLDGETVARLRAAFAEGTTRTACAGCEWFGLCSRVAAQDYAGAKLAFGPLEEST